MNHNKFKSYNDLPLMLSVPELTDVLDISRASAYELVKRKDFPALHIGNRIMIPKEDLISWIRRNTSGEK